MKSPFSEEEYKALLRSIGRDPEDTFNVINTWGGKTDIPCNCGANLLIRGGGKDMTMFCQQCHWRQGFRMKKE